ncbi:FadR/GntR family transcriptional regulator [Agrobacterium sp. rho-13.3]|jgi:DNA-binding FadR family transcriptional regulator|uniref:FadR/GntR family transcriptional regulator n=1 Tax=Agrobacterium sp. rho-13.3 TaxID=3072980 RepID=UPI002A1505EC|nr:FadR/GntR family transcriptional regulator [Agrobacterium sp. rho-13.3]MDX8308227.1 FadR/GntR family transcriptional regulator [Agrobacterium sp. rho-13.3]
MFVALEPRRLHRQVADQIRALIEAGELGVGAKLPAERDLAERFAISRPTVREALIVLEVEGYIQIKVGSGVYVCQRSFQTTNRLPVDDGDSPYEILQARSIIESAIAEEAARLAKPDDIARLDKTLRDMEGAIGDPVTMLVHDRAFHTAITDIIGNATLHRFAGQIFDRRMTPYFERLASHFEGPHTWRLALDEHMIIRNAIAANDAAGARDAMRRHLTASQKRFYESFGEEA